MLDLPAPGHLLDHQLGVHPHLDVGAGGQVRSGAQAGDQARVLGHVVGGGAQAVAQLRPASRRSPRRAPGRRSRPGPDCRASRRRPRRRARSQPGLGVRTRIRRHSSQRSTSSGSAARSGSGPRCSARGGSPRTGRRAARPRRPPVLCAHPSRTGPAGPAAPRWPRPPGGRPPCPPARRSRPARRPAGRDHVALVARDLRPLGRGGPAAALRGLLALHHVEHDLLEVGLPAGQRDDLRLQVLQFAGGRDLCRRPAAGGPGRSGCGPDRRRPRPCPAPARGPSRLASRETISSRSSRSLASIRSASAVSGSLRRRCSSRRQLRVQVGQLKQPQLRLGRCFHGSPR